MVGQCFDIQGHIDGPAMTNETIVYGTLAAWPRASVGRVWLGLASVRRRFGGHTPASAIDSGHDPCGCHRAPVRPAPDAAD